MAFVETTLKLDDLAPGDSRCVEVGGTQVGFFRNADGIFALDNLCPHRGAPLSEGFVSDGQVTCPWHQWQFNLQDGRCRNIPGARVPAYAVDVRDRTIWVNLDKETK
jgi:nitrite reductase (NADH) small subunit/3-phenylpropionate/trans-cinnamate dioxygenase ferredoxin subunit